MRSMLKTRDMVLTTKEAAIWCFSSLYLHLRAGRVIVGPHKIPLIGLAVPSDPPTNLKLEIT